MPAKKKTSKKKVTKKAAAKVEAPKVEEPVEQGVDAYIIMPDMTGVGTTVDGTVYETTHVCRYCDAVMVTEGCGHPVIVCSKCNMKMQSVSRKAEVSE